MVKKTKNTSALKKDYQALYLRALADYQNLEKRFQNERKDVIKFANETLIDKILTVLDDLNRAQEHLKDQGLQMVIDQFNQVLLSENVTPIKTKDEDFNPETMDCVEVVPGPKNKVVITLHPGYLYHDKVLRPARVQVGSGENQ